MKTIFKVIIVVALLSLIIGSAVTFMSCGEKEAAVETDSTTADVVVTDIVITDTTASVEVKEGAPDIETTQDSSGDTE